MPPPHVWIRFELGIKGSQGIHDRVWPAVPGPGDRVQLDGEETRDVLQVVWHETKTPDGALILDRVTVRLGSIRSLPTGDTE